MLPRLTMQTRIWTPALDHASASLFGPLTCRQLELGCTRPLRQVPGSCCEKRRLQGTGNRKIVLLVSPPPPHFTAGFWGLLRQSSVSSYSTSLRPGP